MTFPSRNEKESTINNLSGNQLLVPVSVEVKQLGTAKKLLITSKKISNNSN